MGAIGGTLELSGGECGSAAHHGRRHRLWAVVSFLARGGAETYAMTPAQALLVAWREAERRLHAATERDDIVALSIEVDNLRAAYQEAADVIDAEHEPATAH